MKKPKTDSKKLLLDDFYNKIDLNLMSSNKNVQASDLYRAIIHMAFLDLSEIDEFELPRIGKIVINKGSVSFEIDAYMKKNLDLSLKGEKTMIEADIKKKIDKILEAYAELSEN